MLEASKVTVDGKTYDMNYLGKKRKTGLRRKLIIEYIESKPSGTVIRMHEFQKIAHFSTSANAYAFVKRMLRDGVIMQYAGDRPKSYYYATTGSVRVHSSGHNKLDQTTPGRYDFTDAIENLKKAGLKFTITITNDKE